jgi:putative transposase
MARAVVPGIPHHITQRGNRRQELFFQDEDDWNILIEPLMSHWCKEKGIEINASALRYCSTSIRH